MALKCRQHYATDLDKCQPVELWLDLLNYRDRIVFSDGAFKELTNGIQLGQRIQLSPKLSFDGHCFAELFAHDSYVRPFSQLK